MLKLFFLNINIEKSPSTSAVYGNNEHSLLTKSTNTLDHFAI